MDDERVAELVQRDERMPAPGRAALRRSANAHGGGGLGRQRSEFRSGRELAAFFGLVPRHRASGRRTVMLPIARRCDHYLRTLMVQENVASWRVMEKLEMRREGFFRKCIAHASSEWWDEYFYAILAEEYFRGAKVNVAEKFAKALCSAR